jgi:hypothetical protein
MRSMIKCDLHKASPFCQVHDFLPCVQSVEKVRPYSDYMQHNHCTSTLVSDAMLTAHHKAAMSSLLA